MRKKCLNIFMLLGVFALCSQSCIHEFPMPTPGQSSKPGVDPTTVDASIQVYFDLSWDNIIHNINYDTDTKALNAPLSRFVIEVLQDDEIVCHDVVQMTRDEFSMGELRHRISTPLKPDLYQIGVWFDVQTSEGDFLFNTDQLTKVNHLDGSTTASQELHCGYATDYLDLSNVSPKEEATIVKEIRLSHGGAKFEIVATDIRDFITNNKESLLQGEEYKVKLSFSWPLSQCFNLYGNNYVIDNPSNLEFSGRLRLPYAEYEELKIAEGFLFCRGEDNANLSLSVVDTSLATVVRTSEFTIPIKRGFVTTVRGDFLTGSLGGSFNIDNIWEGEIKIEI